MDNENKCCGTCCHKGYDREEKTFTCGCETAEEYGMEVPYGHCCSEYES